MPLRHHQHSTHHAPQTSLPRSRRRRGGLLAFPSSSTTTTTTTTTIHHVGTTNCRSCVGVYIPITPYLAFVAHINAYTASTTGGSGRYAVDDDAVGAKIQRFTVATLRESAARETWDVGFVDRGKVVVVCPEAEKVDGEA
ncbi:hypothetical protein Tdes44962_MAKER08468 [Teratosphaeria destructans]|uniref:Uncharacterized protein n=1 Tax=Teratosphaeria destructans TaxID=418781 RepID=A0A9W7SW71_9PEZI|nr:hypothetical protein Tdes44962_MAKER08468 [Teratosphaeria destructans]